MDKSFFGGFTLFFLIVATSLSLSGCAGPRADLEREQAAVKEVVDEFPQLMESEDMDLLSQMVAHDPDMVSFGTDAGERWVGYNDLRNAVAAQFASFDAVVLVVRDQVIHVAPSGTVAWCSEVMDWQVTPREGEQTVLQGLRLTGVLEKRAPEENTSSQDDEEARWVFVQLHFSLPVQGQAVAY